MKFRIQKPRQNDSGQALTEAAIGVSLICFGWVMIIFITWMAGNQIRTAMAARHAAWLAGNGGSPTTESIAPDFFSAEEPCKVESADPAELGDLLGGGAFGDVVGSILDAMGGEQYRYKVSYGIDEGEVGDSAMYPFNLMGVSFPYVGETKLANYLRVESFCQWEDVDEIWDDALDVIESILGL